MVQPKSFFDMSEKEKKSILDTANKESSKVMRETVDRFTHCKICLCYYLTGHEHTCDPLMKSLVAFNKDKNKKVDVNKP